MPCGKEKKRPIFIDLHVCFPFQKIQQTIQISELENDPSLDLYHDAPVLPYPSTPANETKDGHDIIDVLARSMHRVARSMSLKVRGFSFTCTKIFGFPY